MLQEVDWACPCKEASQQLGCYLGPQSWGGACSAGQVGVCSDAGEGPELWRSPPPSPVGQR